MAKKGNASTIGEANVVFTADTSDLKRGAAEAKKVRDQASGKVSSGGNAAYGKIPANFFGALAKFTGIAFLIERVSTALISAVLNTKQLAEEMETVGLKANNIEEATSTVEKLNEKLQELNREAVGGGIFEVGANSGSGFLTLINSITRGIESLKNSVTGGKSVEERIKELNLQRDQAVRRLDIFRQAEEQKKTAEAMRKLQESIDKLRDEVKNNTVRQLQQLQSTSGTFNQILNVLQYINAGQTR